MSAWPFVVAAYVVVGLGALGLTLWSWVAMRRAEQALEDPRDV